MKTPLLNKKFLETNQHHDLVKLMELPERVIQFGTGVLLRGLPDYYIHQSNLDGFFNGRIVIVKSTTNGNIQSWKDQDFLFTHCIRGIQNDKHISSDMINASVSRVLQAQNQWSEILDCAANPLINIILSNTTEKGLAYEEENVFNGIPESFPGKVLAYLYRRYSALGDIPQADIVIIPTELVEDNGKLLQSFVIKAAEFNKIDSKFLQWLSDHAYFCNSLVDRIVPGKPDPKSLADMLEKSGYIDDYLIVSEPFHLWAIEGDEKVKRILNFQTGTPGIKIESDISLYKELKLRLLNATHILTCGYAITNGFNTVSDALSDQNFRSRITEILKEIKVSIPKKIESNLVEEFSSSVISRFANPYIRHNWISIILNYTDKIKIRAIPLISQYYSNFGQLPSFMTEGLGAYFYLSIPDVEEDGQFYKNIGEKRVQLNDPYCKVIYHQNQINGVEATIKNTLDYLFADIDFYPAFKQKLEASVFNKYHQINTSSKA
jgi:tagaturonate reductase